MEGGGGIDELWLNIYTYKNCGKRSYHLYKQLFLLQHFFEAVWIEFGKGPAGGYV